MHPRLGDALRWLLTVPAAFAGWYAGIVAGMSMLSLAERLCPPEVMVSGLCTAPWFGPVQRGIFCAAAALAATLVVLLPTLVAPGWRMRVAWIAFALGLLAASAFAAATGAYAELASAALAGALSAHAITRRSGAAATSPLRLGGRHVQVLHVLFIAFVLFGGVLVGAGRGWAWLHLPAVVWASAVNLAGWTCPLTPLEKRLRERDGEPAYSGGFVVHHLQWLLGQPLAARRVERIAGVAVVVWNALVYAGIWLPDWRGPG
ncbi:MAG: DUF2784 domain-containing protein [Rhodocyclaceae bacterium]|nr:DUF2784 domain-containing protein [Rhodocyclaceae bacterium]